MKYAFALAALAGLASANIHARHERLHHRDAEATVTDWTVVTVTDVVTVYGPSPVAEHTAAPAAPSSHATHSAAPSAAASHPAAVSSPAAAPSSPAAVSSPAAAPNTPAQQPTTLSTVPKNEATSAAAAPTSAAAAPTSAAAVPSGGSSSGSGSGSYGLQKGASIKADCPKDKPCTGDMTTYTPGVGACGYDDTGSKNAVALQIEMFGTATNSGVNLPNNPLCNKTISITNKATGVTATGIIRDACPKCTHSDPNGAGIDLAPALDSTLLGGAAADGRLPIEWYFID